MYSKIIYLILSHKEIKSIRVLTNVELHYRVRQDFKKSKNHQQYVFLISIDLISCYSSKQIIVIGQFYISRDVIEMLSI